MYAARNFESLSSPNNLLSLDFFILKLACINVHGQL